MHQVERHVKLRPTYSFQFRQTITDVVCNVVLRLLKEAADDEHFRKRFHLMFGGLLSVVGEKMREELAKQEEFIHMLSAIADKVKAGRDKEVCFRQQKNSCDIAINRTSGCRYEQIQFMTMNWFHRCFSCSSAASK
jgi:hypothetical protein